MVTQILKIVDAAQMSAGYSAAKEFSPHMTHDDVGVVVVKVSQDTALSTVTRPNATSANSLIDIQGSLDNINWVVVARLDMSSTQTVPDFNAPTAIALGTQFGYISASAVIQLFPYFRVKYPTLAGATINVWLMER
jgi:hypothetical protein